MPGGHRACLYLVRRLRGRLVGVVSSRSRPNHHTEGDFVHEIGQVVDDIESGDVATTGVTVDVTERINSPAHGDDQAQRVKRFLTGNGAFASIDAAGFTGEYLVDDVNPPSHTDNKQHPERSRIPGIHFAKITGDQHHQRGDQQTPE